MTWREGLERLRAWAREGEDIQRRDLRHIDVFYRELAIHCARKGTLDDEMPENVTVP